MSHTNSHNGDAYWVQQLLPTVEEQEYVLASFNLDIDAAACGCIKCCPGRQPHFREPEVAPALPDRLCISAEFRKLVQDIDDVFCDTGMPECPCLCFVFFIPCLGFVPLCLMAHCKSRRKSKLSNLIQDFNQNIAKPQGLYARLDNDFHSFLQGGVRRRAPNSGRYITTTDGLNPKLQLVLNVAERRAYCDAHGIRHDTPNPQPQVQNIMTNQGMMMQVIVPQTGTVQSGMVTPVMTQPVVDQARLNRSLMTQPTSSTSDGLEIAGGLHYPTRTGRMTTLQSQRGTIEDQPPSYDQTMHEYHVQPSYNPHLQGKY